ncbi:hypothetical protein HPC38_01105 [Pasteurellaceae bacterium HPA106]|uniref:hypothetical protein n=1 Tax=Spirabiliibacterium pneumoniae TaxID=221400 RepID=UPI001AAD97A2|nr:hypothetical protein [Spirabiliibacterium pneumoniae]MBE2895479.1 hypothetical protein [Spirabiliibacterium pneumoniae]
MESFTLVLSVNVDLSNQHAEMTWSSGEESVLSDMPSELTQTVSQLMKDVADVLPVVSSVFEDYSSDNAPVLAEAKVKFMGKNENWNLSFDVVNEHKASLLIQTLLFRLLMERDAFLAEVEEVKKRCN